MNSPLAGIEAISFDLFDTLIDGRIERLPVLDWGGRKVPSTAGILHEHLSATVPIELDAFLGLMRDVDRELREVYFARGRELPTMVRFAEVVARLDLGSETDADRVVEELGLLHMDLIRAHSTLPAHHPDALARLRAKRRIALCSNFSHTDTAMRILEDFGLRAHLDVIVVSETVGFRKPRREIFEPLLEGLGLAPERVLHVGDDLRADVLGASEMGIRTAWITRRVPVVEAALDDHAGPAPDLVIADLAELEDLLVE